MGHTQGVVQNADGSRASLGVCCTARMPFETVYKIGRLLRLCCSEYVEALKGADPVSKGFYKMFRNKI